MNVQETTGIRELTAQELDQVNGGVILEAAVIGFMTVCMVTTVGCMLGALADWLFGD
jgi:lactobin A/cerein 7B family class IIb bacteriocin